MYVPLCSPVGGIKGKFKKQGFVWFRRNDRQFIRLHVPASDPKTAAQLIHRQRWGQSKRNWSTGPDARQRDQWQAWAVQHLVPRGLSRGGGNAGYNAFQRAELIRMALGMPVGNASPQSGIPGRIVRVEQLPADEATTFRFRMEHDHQALPGTRVLVETTPATLRATRAPRDGDLRWAAGPDAASFLDLKATGETYELRGGLHAVEPGQRFALRVRIVSHEAIAGVPLKTSWTREEFMSSPPPAGPDAPEGAALIKGLPVVASDGSVGSDRSVLTLGSIASRDNRRRTEKRSRQLNRNQKAQLEAFWQSLEIMYRIEWRPPWMKKAESTA